MNPVVYILILSNNKYYVGSTDNIDRRIKEHNNSKTASTRDKRPVKLILAQSFPTLAEARRAEYKKRLKSRKIIENIIINGKINLKLLGV